MTQQTAEPQCDNEQHHDDANAGSAGGFLRSMIRSIVRRIGSSNIGSLPSAASAAKASSNFKVPVKTVVKSAERLGDIIEIGGQIGKVKEQHASNNNAKAIGTAVGAGGVGDAASMSSKIARGAIYVGHALSGFVGFVKSSILGGILFYTYEQLSTSMNGSNVAVLDSTSPPSTPRPPPPTIWISTTSVVIGAIGGATHAAASLSWDAISRQATIFATKQTFVHRSVLLSPLYSFHRGGALAFAPSAVGTFTAHMAVHATLFGTYETTKDVAMKGTGRSGHRYRDQSSNDTGSSSNSYNSSNHSSRESDVDNSDELLSLETHTGRKLAAEAAVVFVSGSVAGAAGEIVQYYIQPLEDLLRGQSVKQASREVFLRFTTSNPLRAGVGVRALAVAGMSSGIGFLAYELGRRL